FEIIRARCNQLQSLPGEIGQVQANLPSGYHRDLQVIKLMLFPAFGTLRDCLTMTHLMLSGIQVRENILSEERYQFLFSVEEVNKLVLSGMPFRDAYRKVGEAIESGQFRTDGNVRHTHIGSIGDPGNERIRVWFEQQVSGFGFDTVNDAVERLINGA
ncbi:MAG: argininosuccinate lyase, partial [Bacteroidota bacterium]